jgi:hypothetical protein
VRQKANAYQQTCENDRDKEVVAGERDEQHARQAPKEPDGRGGGEPRALRAHVTELGQHRGEREQRAHDKTVPVSAGTVVLGSLEPVRNIARFCHEA